MKKANQSGLNYLKKETYLENDLSLPKNGFFYFVNSKIVGMEKEGINGIDLLNKLCEDWKNFSTEEKNEFNKLALEKQIYDKEIEFSKKKMRKKSNIKENEK